MLDLSEMWQTQLCVVKKPPDLILLCGKEEFLNKEQLITYLYDFVDASGQEKNMGLLEVDIKNDLDILCK